MIVLEAVGLVKRYTSADGGTITVLDGLNLRVERGEMVAVVGASGAGKSTLLHLLGALDRPTEGYAVVGGIRLDGGLHESTGVEPSAAPKTHGESFFQEATRRRTELKRDGQLSELRNRSIGFVFQFHHLLREFSALENVMMPLRLAAWDQRKARARGEELLDRVGLASRMHHRPAELSGGEQQRTAVARALAVGPAVVLADEPSGNLDHKNSELLHDLFVSVVRDFEVAMVIATHNRLLAGRADRVLSLEGGRLERAEIREVVP